MPGPIPDGGSRDARPEAAIVSVTFEYRAATEVDPEILEARSPCLILVGRTHIHPSWHDFQLFPLLPQGEELWTRRFDDVPQGSRRIRVSDPNACPLNPTGAVTARAIFANGTLLTTPADTPGTGIEPGFSFSVDENGVVTP